MAFQVRFQLILVLAMSLILAGCDDDTCPTVPSFAPTTHTVALDGSGDHVDLASAVAAAASGDTILIDGGVYNGDGNVNLDFGLKSLTLIGDDDAATPVVIDASAHETTPVRLLSLDGDQGSETLIAHITFRGGDTGTGGFGEDGGAIRLEGTSPWFRDCRFDSCTARRGGAVVSLGGSPRFQDCVFRANTTDFGSIGYDDGGGAAVFALGGAPVFLDCAFTDNQSLGGDGVSRVRGGALVLMETDGAVISGCTFTGNSCDKNGGGLGLKAASPTLTGCRFLRNSAYTGGGMAWDQDSKPALTACDFDSNWASYDGGVLVTLGDLRDDILGCRFRGNAASFQAGAVLVNGDAIFRDCVFSRNQSSSVGGAIRINGETTLVTFVRCDVHGNQSDTGGAIAVMYESAAVVTGCTFTANTGGRGGAINVFEGTLQMDSSTLAGNRAWTEGAALAFDSGSGYANTVTGSILYGNLGAAAVATEGERVTFVCSDIYGHAEGNWTGDIAQQLGVDGNIEMDPMFCGAAGFELWLESDSPCAESGAGCGVMGARGVGCQPD
jgi:hypothetical protein